MDKCDCYCESYEITGWLGPYEQIRKLRKRCNGTKERDECSCGGDRIKCNFYPEVREMAKKNIGIQDAINHFKYGISHDIFQEPVASYAEMAVVALKKQLSTEKVVTNADRIRAMTDDELADFFYGSPDEEFGICYYCKNFGGAGSPEPCKTPYGGCMVEDKNDAFKKWLKQPVK